MKILSKINNDIRWNGGNGKILKLYDNAISFGNENGLSLTYENDIRWRGLINNNDYIKFVAGGSGGPTDEYIYSFSILNKNTNKSKGIISLNTLFTFTYKSNIKYDWINNIYSLGMNDTFWFSLSLDERSDSGKHSEATIQLDIMDDLIIHQIYEIGLDPYNISIYRKNKNAQNISW